MWAGPCQKKWCFWSVRWRNWFTSSQFLLPKEFTMFIFSLPPSLVFTVLWFVASGTCWNIAIAAWFALWSRWKSPAVKGQVGWFFQEQQKDVVSWMFWVPANVSSLFVWVFFNSNVSWVFYLMRAFASFFPPMIFWFCTCVCRICQSDDGILHWLIRGFRSCFCWMGDWTLILVSFLLFLLLKWMQLSWQNVRTSVGENYSKKPPTWYFCYSVKVYGAYVKCNS